MTDVGQLANRFLDDDRALADNDTEATELVQACVNLFQAANTLSALSLDEVDDALFNASFDVGVAICRYEIGTALAADLAEAAERLFLTYYTAHPGFISCGQFWDNVLGYRDLEEFSKSGREFLDWALKVLERLAAHPSRHIRASALHGLNHHPNLEVAAARIRECLDRETDVELRKYAEDALRAFSEGRRLV